MAAVVVFMPTTSPGTVQPGATISIMPMTAIIPAYFTALSAFMATKINVTINVPIRLTSITITIILPGCASIPAPQIQIILQIMPLSVVF